MNVLVSEQFQWLVNSSKTARTVPKQPEQFQNSPNSSNLEEVRTGTLKQFRLSSKLELELKTRFNTFPTVLELVRIVPCSSPSHRYLFRFLKINFTKKNFCQNFLELDVLNLRFSKNLQMAITSPMLIRSV